MPSAATAKAPLSIYIPCVSKGVTLPLHTAGETRYCTPRVDFQSSVTLRQVRFPRPRMGFRKESCRRDLSTDALFGTNTFVLKRGNRALKLGPGGVILHHYGRLVLVPVPRCLRSSNLFAPCDSPCVVTVQTTTRNWAPCCREVDGLAAAAGRGST